MGDWGQRWVLGDNIAEIKHIESDGEWLVVATTIFIKVLKIEVDKEPSLVANIPQAATKVVLAYPFLLCVNEDKFEGLKVWNLEKQ